MGTPIEVKSTAKNGEVGVTMFDFGDSAAEAVEMFGDSVVHAYFVSHGKVVLQAAQRRYLQAGVSLDKLEDWKPGETATRISDPVAAVKAKYATMSDEEKAAFIASLQEM